jgi:tetratricopeptide (TPR) repeat protein
MIVGRMSEAIANWEHALRIKPDYAEVHFDLAVALEKSGRIQDAVEHYELALKFQPDLVEARQQLMRLRPEISQ